MPTSEQIEAAAKAWWLAGGQGQEILAPMRAALEAAEALEEVEYTWQSSDASDEPWTLDREFPTIADAEAFADGRGAWIREESGILFHRRPASPWIALEGETDHA